MNCCLLSARKDRAKIRFGKDAGNFFAFISLNFDLAFFDGAARSAGRLHRARQALLLRQTDTNKSPDHCNGLAAASRLLPHDIHPPTTLSWRAWERWRLAGEFSGRPARYLSMDLRRDAARTRRRGRLRYARA